MNSLKLGDQYGHRLGDEYEGDEYEGDQYEARK